MEAVVSLQEAIAGVAERVGPSVVGLGLPAIVQQERQRRGRTPDFEARRYPARLTGCRCT
jgi:hypothetical protein